MSLQLASFSCVADVLATARSKIGEILSAFEFMDLPSMRTLRDDSPHLTSRVQASLLPELGVSVTAESTHSRIGIDGPVLLLLECSGFCAKSDMQRYVIGFSS